MGLKAHVVEFASRLMPRQLDPAGSSLLREKLEQLGIAVHVNKNTQRIEGNGKLTGLHFSDGSTLAVDMLVISAGIKPRDELAKECGLATAPRGGIRSEEHTSELQSREKLVCRLLLEK